MLSCMYNEYIYPRKYNENYLGELELSDKFVPCVQFVSLVQSKSVQDLFRFQFWLGGQTKASGNIFGWVVIRLFATQSYKPIGDDKSVPFGTYNT